MPGKFSERSLMPDFIKIISDIATEGIYLTRLSWDEVVSEEGMGSYSIRAATEPLVSV